MTHATSVLSSSRVAISDSVFGIIERALSRRQVNLLFDFFFISSFALFSVITRSPAARHCLDPRYEKGFDWPVGPELADCEADGPG